MWKLLEKALGRTETEEPAKQDSELAKQDTGIAARDAGFANRGGVAPMPNELKNGKTVAEGAAKKTPEASPGGAQPAAGVSSGGASAAATPDLAELEGKVKNAMRTVYDPEIPINIYELGLIYGLEIEPEGKVRVQMTLTAPSCPEAQWLPSRVQQVIQEVPGVSEVTVELVWEPPWTPKQMSEAARLQLGIF